VIPNREKFGALWDFIDATAKYVDTWPYWKRGGTFAEAEDRARAAEKAQEEKATAKPSSE
jgi:hypothetical protein